MTEVQRNDLSRLVWIVSSDQRKQFECIWTYLKTARQTDTCNVFMQHKALQRKKTIPFRQNSIFHQHPQVFCNAVYKVEWRCLLRFACCLWAENELPGIRMLHKDSCWLRHFLSLCNRCNLSTGLRRNIWRMIHDILLSTIDRAVNYVVRPESDHYIRHHSCFLDLWIVTKNREHQN